jgi:acyl-CoA synthetase (AMP-forming)/AMP-acid ligase II
VAREALDPVRVCVDGVTSACWVRVAVALLREDRSLTYAELARRVRRLANGLRRLGVGHGDRVAWLGPNHPAMLESLFALGWWARRWRR